MYRRLLGCLLLSLIKPEVVLFLKLVIKTIVVRRGGCKCNLLFPQIPKKNNYYNTNKIDC